MSVKVGSNWKTITAGHRLSWHEHCKHAHGHGFKVRILVEGEIDAEKGIVVDFKELGAVLDTFHAELDHKFLAPRGAVLHKELFVMEDCDTGDSLKEYEFGESYVIDGKYVLPKEDVVVMPFDEVSTENLASYFLMRVIAKDWVRGKTITVQVTENGDNVAEASLFVPVQTWNTTGWTSTITAPPYQFYWYGNAAAANPMTVWSDITVNV